MACKIGLIMDSMKNKSDKIISNEFDTDILKITSSLIYEILQFDFTIQIAVLAFVEDSVIQVSHLSGNIRHHYQGIRRCLKKQKKTKNLLNEGLTMFRRLFFENKKNEKINVFFINSNFYHDGDFHKILAGLIKDEIIFHGISICQNSFVVELLAKMSGGVNLVYKEKKFNGLISNVKQILLRKSVFNTSILRHSFANRKILEIKNNVRKKKQWTYNEFCINCKLEKKLYTTEACKTCGNGLNIKILNKNRIDVESIKQKIFIPRFSFFSLKLEWEKKQIFPFSYISMPRTIADKCSPIEIYMNFFTPFFFYKNSFSKIMNVIR